MFRAVITLLTLLLAWRLISYFVGNYFCPVSQPQPIKSFNGQPFQAVGAQGDQQLFSVQGWMLGSKTEAELFMCC